MAVVASIAVESLAVGWLAVGWLAAGWLAVSADSTVIDLMLMAAARQESAATCFFHCLMLPAH